MYAVEMLPSSPPKTAHMALSKKPRPNSSGPSSPTARLLTEMLAENQSKATEMSSHRDGGMRSSGSTRAMPRASKPERLSIRALRALSPERGGLSEIGVVSGPSLSDVVVAAAADFSTSWFVSDAIVLVSGLEMLIARCREKGSGKETHGSRGLMWGVKNCTGAGRTKRRRDFLLRHFGSGAASLHSTWVGALPTCFHRPVWELRAVWNAARYCNPLRNCNFTPAGESKNPPVATFGEADSRCRT